MESIATVICDNCGYEAAYFEGIIEAGCPACGQPLKEKKQCVAEAVNAEGQTVNEFIEEVKAQPEPEQKIRGLHYDTIIIDDLVPTEIDALNLQPGQIVRSASPEEMQAFDKPIFTRRNTADQTRMTMRLEADVYAGLWELHTKTHKSLVALVNEYLRKGLKK